MGRGGVPPELNGRDCRPVGDKGKQSGRWNAGWRACIATFRSLHGARILCLAVWSLGGPPNTKPPNTKHSRGIAPGPIASFCCALDAVLHRVNRRALCGRNRPDLLRPGRTKVVPDGKKSASAPEKGDLGWGMAPPVPAGSESSPGPNPRLDLRARRANARSLRPGCLLAAFVVVWRARTCPGGINPPARSFPSDPLSNCTVSHLSPIRGLHHEPATR
jgi:hypothetical protein